MRTDSLRRLAEMVEQLAELSEEAHRLAADNPAASRNLYMIQQHLEMLRIEICEPLQVLQQGEDADDG